MGKRILILLLRKTTAEQTSTEVPVWEWPLPKI